MVTELLECQECKKKWPIGGSMHECPYCRSANVIVFGDEEDEDAMNVEQTDQFKEDGTRRGTGSSVRGA